MILLYSLLYLIIIYYVYGERKGGGVGIGWSDESVDSTYNTVITHMRCTSIYVLVRITYYVR